MPATRVVVETVLVWNGKLRTWSQIKGCLSVLNVYPSGSIWSTEVLCLIAEHAKCGKASNLVAMLLTSTIVICNDLGLWVEGVIGPLEHGLSPKR